MYHYSFKTTKSKRSNLKSITNIEFIHAIIQGLDSPLLSTKTSVLDFLLVLTVDGPELVLSAFSALKASKSQARMFGILVSSMSEVVNNRGLFGTAVGGNKTTEIQEYTVKDIKDYLVILMLI